MLFRSILAKLIILRGNSGSGKTTVAKALQQKLGPNTMVLSQDVIRREMLQVKDGADTKALPLSSELLVYGENHCEVVILEGILNAKWYQPLFELAQKLFGNQIWAYYYDLPFEETLKRHRTRSNKDEFGKEKMAKWWNEKDFLEIIPEKVISKDESLTETIELILQDISE